MKKEATKENTVSDRAEKKEGLDLIGKDVNQKFANVNARGCSIEECPVLPIGPAIYLKYNLPAETKIVGVANKDRKPLKPYFTIIGIGATVCSVNIGDKVIVKPEAQVNTYDTADFKSDEVPAYKYHKIYEYDISDILK